MDFSAGACIISVPIADSLLFLDAPVSFLKAVYTICPAVDGPVYKWGEQHAFSYVRCLCEILHL